MAEDERTRVESSSLFNVKSLSIETIEIEQPIRYLILFFQLTWYSFIYIKGLCLLAFLFKNELTEFKNAVFLYKQSIVRGLCLLTPLFFSH